MNKLKNILIILIIGLAATFVAVAFTGPGSLTPGTGNPDFWIKSGDDIYYHPAVSGNVGIGTTGPGYKLHVAGATDIIDVQGATNAFYRATNKIGAAAATGDFSFGVDDGSGAGANAFIIYDRVNSAYRFVLNNAGNVGIGMTPGSYALDVNGTVNATTYTKGGAAINAANGLVALDGSSKLPAVDGSQLTNVSAGRVLQVVQTAKTDTASYASQTFGDLPGMSVTITPSSASNKVLVRYHLNLGCSSGLVHIQLFRGATQIAMGDAAGSRTRATNANFRFYGDNNDTTQISFEYLDSPATASAVTYKLKIATEGGYTVYLNRTINDADSFIGARGISTITAEEIKG